MARINQGILGGLSGSVANVVGGSWKGINYIRAKPTSVANPRTTPQVEQRNRFSTSVRLGKSILAGWIKPLFDRFAIQQSGMNVWVSENLQNCDENGFIDPSLAVMAKGAMTMTPIVAGTPVSPDTLPLTWSTTPPDNLSSGSDVLYLAVYDNVAQVFVASGVIGVTRASGSGNLFVAGANFNTGNYSVYSSFRNVEGLRVSSSYFFSV